MSEMSEMGEGRQLQSDDLIPDDQSMVDFFRSMEGARLGTLSFNLGGIAWIGLNLTLGENYLPYYQPCAYLVGGSFSVIFAPLLLFAFVLALMAIKKGSLLPAAITLTFVWAMACSVVRVFSLSP